MSELVFAGTGKDVLCVKRSVLRLHMAIVCKKSQGTRWTVRANEKRLTIKNLPCHVLSIDLFLL